MKIVVFTDGGARSNPGPAGVGVVVSGDVPEVTHGRYIGEATNNTAEYTALLDALEMLPGILEENAAPKDCEIEFKLDSQLVVYQITGRYRVKEPSLIPLYNEVRRRLQALPARAIFTHVPRAQNAQADRLYNQALDAHLNAHVQTR